MSDPLPKYARVNANDPEAWAVCDRCGFWRNRTDLVWQTAWAGTHLYNVQILVCSDRCFDIPQEQLRTIILPPDPPPVLNARVPNYAYEEAGPVQSILTANVAQGAILLPVQSAVGFVVGNNVWVQLNNANLAEEQLTGVDLVNNVLSILSPMPFSAPINGVVSVSST